MAYRLEKEPNGKEAIVIDGWENGISPDPYSGCNSMLGVNLETPKEISVGYGITQNATSGATLATPIARSTRLFTYNTPGIPAGSPQSFAILDASGQVFESTSIAGTYAYLSSNATTSGSSNLDGMAHWLGFLFKTRGANIDYWNGSTWANGWQTTLNGGFKHYMYVGSDNVLYITNGNYLASITAPTPTSFDPTSSGTYALSVTKLQLPVTDFALSIAEVGGGNTPQSTLLVGGSQNAIYPWDKVSSSFALPIYVADGYIGKMVSVNQNAFIFPGNVTGRGRIYITNGSQADLYFKIPDYTFGVQDPYYEWGDAIWHRNNLLFSFFVDDNGTSTVLQGYSYVWALNLGSHTAATGVVIPEKTFRAISALPLTSTFVANATCLLSAQNLATPGFGYIAAWSDTGSSPAIGYSGTTAGVGNGTLLTELIPVGTLLQKRTFTQIEFKLRTALASGETISIAAYSDGFANSVMTFSPTVTTGSISGVAPVNFQNNQWLQLFVSFTGNSSSSGVRLKELRIR